METRIALFQKKEIRKTLHAGEWWLVVEDVVFALTDSRDPKQYFQRMKQRDLELAKGWVQFVHTLSIETVGGPQRMLCANTEGIFRLIQSIPSPKAEPFKRWLARVGYERVQEIEDPEIATKAIPRELLDIIGIKGREADAASGKLRQLVSPNTPTCPAEVSVERDDLTRDYTPFRKHHRGSSTTCTAASPKNGHFSLPVAEERLTRRWWHDTRACLPLDGDS